MMMSDVAQAILASKPVNDYFWQVAFSKNTLQNTILRRHLAMVTLLAERCFVALNHLESNYSNFRRGNKK